MVYKYKFTHNTKKHIYFLKLLSTVHRSSHSGLFVLHCDGGDSCLINAHVQGVTSGGFVCLVSAVL